KPYRKSQKQPSTFVSVIIAARNEADKIAKTINDVLAQTYPKNIFELIIIDDHSTDSTAEIVKSYNGVKLIQLNEDKALNSYKKMAIQTAIGQAKGDLIITTDADCRMGAKWLAAIVDYYETKDFK